MPITTSPCHTPIKAAEVESSNGGKSTNTGLMQIVVISFFCDGFSFMVFAPSDDYGFRHLRQYKIVI